MVSENITGVNRTDSYVDIKCHKSLFFLNEGSVYYSLAGKTTYEISILVCVYNPDITKLFLTIDSILLQKNIDFQIVITDDGSEIEFYDEMIQKFKERCFKEYVICKLNNNQGTVKNIMHGLRYCRGDFVKLISPGDYLYGCNILREWVDYIKDNEAVLSFSNIICYKTIDNIITPIKTRAWPQVVEKYYKNMWGYNYLIFGDAVVGAGTLVSKEVMLKYISILARYIKYAEDNMYKLMACNNEPMVFFDKETVLYELGSGISTSNSEKWTSILTQELKITNDIIDETGIHDEQLSRYYRKLKSAEGKKTKIYCEILKLFIPGLLRFRIKKNFAKRYTNNTIDERYLSTLLGK